MSIVRSVAGLGVGLVGGIMSGLLGVSPGGGLARFGCCWGPNSMWHRAYRWLPRYHQPFRDTALLGKGSRTPVNWLVLLTIGFLAGGIAGRWRRSAFQARC